jgi:serine/threonine-protein phosphatase 5
MASAEQQAAAFKNDGNKAFAAHDFITAIELYTKAIELNDKEPTYFSNRAQVLLASFKIAAPVTDQPQANIKTEAYGYAIADATRAIELDPNFVKVGFFFLASL